MRTAVGFTRAAEFSVQRVEEPGEKVNGVALLGDFKLFVTDVGDFLQKVMRTDVALECLWVPNLAHQQSKSFD